MSIRDEFLRLLREDEVFRYAVMGLLGITDVQSGIRQLTDALNKVLDIVKGLADAEARHMEITQRILEEIKALREGQDRLWQENNKLWQEVKALREGQDKLWEEVRRINENIERLLQENKRINENIERLWKENQRIWREIVSIKRTIDRISITLEEEANDVIQYLLSQRGIVIETKPIHIGGYEFDIYGTNGQYTIIGEVKTRVSKDTVDHIAERINNTIKTMPDKFPGKIIKTIYCMRTLPGAVEEANKLGIWLIESGRERNTPNI